MKKYEYPGTRAELVRRMDIREYVEAKIAENNEITIEEYRRIRDALQTYLFERDPAAPLSHGIKDRVHSSISPEQLVEFRMELEQYIDVTRNIPQVGRQAAVRKLLDVNKELARLMMRNNQKVATKAARPKVHQPPGSWLLRICRKVFKKKFMREVLEHTIVDMQFEYIEAIDSGDKWDLRLVYIRGYASFLLALITGLTATVGKKLVDAWKAVNL